MIVDCEEKFLDSSSNAVSDSEIKLILTDPIEEETEDLCGVEETKLPLSCIAHSLQLAIRGGLSNISYLSKTLAKYKQLSKKSHKSTGITDIITNTIGDDTLSFSSTDINILDEVIEILEPFTDITVICQSENTATISMMVPAILHIHVVYHLIQMNSKLHY